ncbi:MAG: 3-oxoacyl-ACP synthase [Flavobacteriales bacterium]|nr:3-oxoacyl-ACP synthase [Flavobacteriales bacterium]
MSNPFKSTVHKHCLEQLAEGIQALQTALENAQHSANQETKSSAGDKHETGRAMAQLEVEKLAVQLNQSVQAQEYLMRFTPDQPSGQIIPGSLVETDRGWFYLSIPLGKQIIAGQTVFVISGISPIGKMLLSRTENDRFTFNGTEYLIKRFF